MATTHLLLPLLLVAPGDPQVAGHLPKLNVILFTPADVEPPSRYGRRLTEVADYTEAFLVRWMKQWDYAPEREKIFERRADGTLHVLPVRGRHVLASGRYDKPTFSAEVWSTAQSKYKLGRHRHVWWVWVYLGKPSLRFGDFRGSGNVQGGGTAFVNYPALTGGISPRDALGSRFLTEFALKGCIHELGHALGLPHNGPVWRENLGMPLMGATIRNYRRRAGKPEPRGYLTRASAAMLWRHPLFSGTVEQRNKMPTLRVTDLKSSLDRAARTVHVTGKIVSDMPAHSIVVMDSVPKQQEQYWQKSYVARVDESGQFDVTITEPTRAAGKLRILCCFANGAVTGDGRKYGIPGVLEVPYTPASTAGYRLRLAR